MMNGTTALTHEALWNAIYLLNDAVVGIFGMILSAAFCDLDWTRKRLLRYWGCMAVILLVQAAVYCVADVALLRAIYPLVTHLPLVVVLCVMKRQTIWPIVSVLTAYLCCQIRRWIALLAMACFNGGSYLQSTVELIVTLPLLWVLLKFFAPAVREIGRLKPSMQFFFGIMPAISYAFDYLTRIYTDMLERGLAAAVEFMPSMCCVLYLVLVLRSSAENAARSRLEQIQEGLRLQVSQATREISSLRESDRQASTYRHDLRHHMQFLSGCIENGQTERAQAYIRQVCAEIEAQKVRRFCENEAVNLILSSFAQRAEDSGVPLRVRAEVPQFLPVAETDLCVLLSNALENALHACQRLRAESKDCDIEAVAYEKSGKFFLQVSNTCGPDVRFRKGLPVTEAEGHGIGVRSICSIVERYNGVYSFTANNGRFTLRASL